MKKKPSKAKNELSPRWQKAIRKLDRLGAELQEEFRRKDARAMKAANDMIRGEI